MAIICTVSILALLCYIAAVMIYLRFKEEYEIDKNRYQEYILDPATEKVYAFYRALLRNGNASLRTLYDTAFALQLFAANRQLLDGVYEMSPNEWKWRKRVYAVKSVLFLPWILYHEWFRRPGWKALLRESEENLLCTIRAISEHEDAKPSNRLLQLLKSETLEKERLRKQIEELTDNINHS